MGEIQTTARTTGIVTEGVIKGFLAVAPALLIISMGVGASIWLARLGTRLGGLN